MVLKYIHSNRIEVQNNILYFNEKKIIADYLFSLVDDYPHQHTVYLKNRCGANIIFNTNNLVDKKIALCLHKDIIINDNYIELLGTFSRFKITKEYLELLKTRHFVYEETRNTKLIRQLINC